MSEPISPFLDASSKDDSAGFSLLEVLIAAGLFAIVLIGNAALLNTTIKANVANRNLTTATFLGQDLSERLKALPFADSALDDGLHPDLGNNPMSADGTPGGIFTRIWTVQLGNNNQLKTITITVSWTTSRDHEVTFTLVKDNQ